MCPVNLRCTLRYKVQVFIKHLFSHQNFQRLKIANENSIRIFRMLNRNGILNENHLIHTINLHTKRNF